MFQTNGKFVYCDGMGFFEACCNCSNPSGQDVNIQGYGSIAVLSFTYPIKHYFGCFFFTVRYIPWILSLSLKFNQYDAYRKKPLYFFLEKICPEEGNLHFMRIQISFFFHVSALISWVWWNKVRRFSLHSGFLPLLH